MKDKYVIEQLGAGFVVIDASGERGKFGEAYAGSDKTWRDQPVGVPPFETQSAAEQWADSLS